MDPISLIAGGANVLGGLVSGLFGGGQKRKARKILADNPYPTASVQNELYQNKNLASQMAASGMGASQYGQAYQNIQRNQTSALNAAQTRRGGIGSIGAIQQRTNDAQLGLDAQNAQMRRQNQQLLMNANTQLGSAKDRVWDWNVKNKYQQNYNYAMGLMGAGNQNIAGGIDRGIGGLATLGAGLFGGSNKSRGFSGGQSGDPRYYNGYGPGSSYSSFENGF